MSKKRGLGKGLNALIPPPEDQLEEVFLCPVEAISPLTDQPRKQFDHRRLEELAQTIREKGVLSPVIVRRSADGYQLISGERRWRAARMCGLEHIPAVLREVSDKEALELSLIENLQREDLTPLEEARAYQCLLELYGTTQEELARRLGKDRSTISNALRLLRLSPAIQESLEAGEITAGHARCLLSVPLELQDSLHREIIKRGLSVRQTESLARKMASSRPMPVQRPPQRLPLELEEVRNRLRRRLSTQVRIVQGKRKGKIVIEFYSREDLFRIASLLDSQGH